MKEETFFANKLVLICTINSTMNRKNQLNCITSGGRLNFPIFKALSCIIDEMGCLNAGFSLWAIIIYATSPFIRAQTRSHFELSTCFSLIPLHLKNDLFFFEE